MQFMPSGTPNNCAALGVLGYLIVVNKQVHSYQVDALTEYLELIHLNINETLLSNIIEGNDESVSFETSLTAFSGELENIQRDIYYMLIVLSFVDNSIDDNETALINQIIEASKISTDDVLTIKQTAMVDAESIRSSKNVLFERIDTDVVDGSIFQRFIRWTVRFFHRIFNKDIGDEKTLSDIDYKAMIEKCAQVALEDFKVIRPSYSYVLQNDQSCIDQLNKYKRSLSLETGLSAEVANIVKLFIEALNENVLKQRHLAEMSLAQKERTIPDFTISLIGRTKAGKSTLHAILTNQGYDKIGVGMQRTTKYNRVYQWNLLRLIDTPGIGSAEAAGRTDDEIAESILGESDVICFVVVDDSILKDVLEFIEKVAALNKPVIILLNHKENIMSDVKFKRFVEKPLDWLTNGGESNLQGHINRIQKYADDHGFGTLIKVFPVFLLAAQMAGEEKYKENRKLLWENSNIDSFIDQLKIWIFSAGTIKRSQTILDEAIHIFDKLKEEILMAQKPVEEQVNKLTEQRANKIDALRQAQDAAINNVRTALEEIINNLANNEALVFAEDVYGQKGAISEMWTSYLEKINFEDDAKTAIEAELNSFVKKADNTISDLFEDFYYSVKASFEVGDVNIPMQLDLKSISRLAGSALGVAGSIVIILGLSNPVGWILTVAGIAIGLSSLLFSSKEKKRKETIDKVHLSIKDNILKQAPEQIDSTISDIKGELSRGIERIDSLFSDLINGLKEALAISEQLTQGYETQIEMINKVYAWRILQFLSQKTDSYSPDNVNNEIESVNRSIKGTITIQRKNNGKLDTDGLDGIIADKVIIN